MRAASVYLQRGAFLRSPPPPNLPQRGRDRIFAIAIAALLLAGCGREDPESKVQRVPAATLHGDGVIRGKIIFDGKPPEEIIVRNSPCCPGAPPMQRDETVTVNPDGTLANCFVYLEGGPKADGSALPAPVLDQVYCQYQPHVIGVMVNQPLTIRSSDATLHNVQIRPDPDPTMNFYMQREGDHATAVFKRQQIVKSQCDVHNWMNAWIGVFDNPYFAVTGDHGTFEIKNVPAGTYTLVVSHERYGRQSQPITISNSTPIELNFTYKPPQ